MSFSETLLQVGVLSCDTTTERSAIDALGNTRLVTGVEIISIRGGPAAGMQWWFSELTTVLMRCRRRMMMIRVAIFASSRMVSDVKTSAIAAFRSEVNVYRAQDVDRS